MGKIVEFVFNFVALVLMCAFATFFMVLKREKDQERKQKYETYSRFNDK